MSGHRCLRAGGESLRPLQTGSGLGTGRGHKPGRWSALTRECEHTGEERGRKGGEDIGVPAVLCPPQRRRGREPQANPSTPASSPGTLCL